jgi:hypothetical protein
MYCTAPEEKHVLEEIKNFSKQISIVSIAVLCVNTAQPAKRQHVWLISNHLFFTEKNFAVVPSVCNSDLLYGLY